MSKTLLTVVFIFQFILIKAQDLTVKGDNFLYVDNTVLFVNGGIDLQDEQTKSLDPVMGDDGGDTNGSNIYLRNGAQLIQGDDSSDNTGEGNLSIIVGGTANKWSYNFWGAPVSHSDGNGFYLSQLDEPLNSDGSLNKTYGISTKSINSRPANFTSDWNSSREPMMTISSRWLYKLTEPENWVRLDPNSSAIQHGYGFAMKGLGSSDNYQGLHPYDLRGIPNNGEIKVSIKKTGDRLTLIGNPYPSILNLKEFTKNNPDKIASYRFWEAGTDQSHYYTESEGGYATLVINNDGTLSSFTPAVMKKYKSDGSDSDETAESKPQKTASPYIPIGQGFLVEMNQGFGTESTELVFKNTQRVYKNRVGTGGKGEGGNTNTGDFFRPGKNNKKDDHTNSIPREYMQFKLNISFNDLIVRPLLLNFHESATNNFDVGLEARPIEFLENDGYLGNKQNPFIIQAFKFDKYLSIPMYINLKTQSQIEFNAHDFINFPEDLDIYLHDLYTDNYTNLKVENFSLIVNSGEYNNRFEITFKENSELNKTDFEANNFKIVSDNQNKKIIVYNPKLKSVKTIKLFDMSGKEVSRLNVNSTKNSYEIATSEISNGVFIAQLESRENTKCSKRVIINK